MLRIDADWATEVVGDPAFGDQRLVARHRAPVTALAERPEQPLAQAVGSWTATRAASRFWRNPAVDVGELRRSAGVATAARCREEPRVLLLQVTIAIRPSAPDRCQGLGPLGATEANGLWLHTALAAIPGGPPCGLLEQHVWARDPEDAGGRQL